MYFEYKNNNIILKVISSDYTEMVLDFYYRNKEIFDKYETDKPDNFYTSDFISNLLTAEYKTFLNGKFVRFFMFEKDNPDYIIGTVSFSHIKGGDFKSCNIGYKIDKNFQHQGFGRKMLTLALKIMVTEHNLHRIEAYISPDNKFSEKLVKDLGFISEGTAYSYVLMNGKWQDHLRYVYIS